MAEEQEWSTKVFAKAQHDDWLLEGALALLSKQIDTFLHKRDLGYH